MEQEGFVSHAKLLPKDDVQDVMWRIIVIGTVKQVIGCTINGTVIIIINLLLLLLVGVCAGLETWEIPAL
jgi:hypothetical protein